MKSTLFFVFVLTVAAFCLPVSAGPEDTVEETATGKFFPVTVAFEHDGGEYTLNLTGVAARKKAVFKVYGVAHYLDAEHSAVFDDKDAAFEAVLDDKYAKQLVLDFARGVEAKKIQKAFSDGFNKSASDEERVEIQTLFDGFLTYFEEDVEENDQYVFRWLPGGVLLTTVKGVEQEPIVSVGLATVLWEVWLGEKSIVKRDKLVKLVVAD